MPTPIRTDAQPPSRTLPMSLKDDPSRTDATGKQKPDQPQHERITQQMRTGVHRLGLMQSPPDSRAHAQQRTSNDAPSQVASQRQLTPGTTGIAPGPVSNRHLRETSATLPLQQSPSLSDQNATQDTISYQNLATTIGNNLPRPHQAAEKFMTERIKHLTGKDIDPNKIYYNQFDVGMKQESGPDIYGLGYTYTPPPTYSYDVISDSNAYLGTRHAGPPRQSQTLTQLAFTNFPPGEEINTEKYLNQTTGFYTEGTAAQHGYGAHNEFALRPSALRDDLWNNDFSARYGAQVDNFWRDHQDQFRTVSKGAYLLQANQEYASGRLTKDEHEIALHAAGHEPLSPGNRLSMAHLQATSSPASDVKVESFHIKNHGSTDILHLSREDKHLLYIPGAKQPFQAFDSRSDMYQWVADQSKNPETRRQLASHFSLHNRQNGLVHNGVDKNLAELGVGKLPADSTVFGDMHTYDIKEDIFSHLAEKSRQRMRNDANTLTTSHAELQKEMAADELHQAIMYGAPFVALTGPFAPLILGAAAVAELGLGIDAMVNGDNEEQRITGLNATLDGATNLLFAAMPEVASETSSTEKPGFNPPTKLDDGRAGYPLSPTKPPKLPAASEKPSGTAESTGATGTTEPTATAGTSAQGGAASTSTSGVTETTKLSASEIERLRNDPVAALTYLRGEPPPPPEPARPWYAKKKYEELGMLRDGGLLKDIMSKQDGAAVPYMNAQQRLAYQVTADGNGLLTQRAPNGDPVLMNTIGANNPKDAYLFAMDRQGNIYAGSSAQVRNHSAFLAGYPVTAVGEITVRDGVVTKISDFSGHYAAPRDYLDQALRELRSRGVNVSNTEIRYTGLSKKDLKKMHKDGAPPHVRIYPDGIKEKPY